jgi:hypothetical protein
MESIGVLDRIKLKRLAVTGGWMLTCVKRPAGIVGDGFVEIRNLPHGRVVASESQEIKPGVLRRVCV